MINIVLLILLTADIIVSISIYKRYYRYEKALKQITLGKISYPKMLEVAFKALKGES